MDKAKNIAYPCAKINLGLNIVERRPDGYHNIETVFYPIPLCDELTICEDDEDRLTISGIPVSGETKDNLVMRALFLLRKDHDIPPVSISLKKNIPSGAGLGGGSSDASETIKMLNSLFMLGMSEEEMEKKASLIGADCAFFIKKKPTMAKGIGNEFSSIQIDLAGRYLVLVKPDDYVSTREAYSMVIPRKPEIKIEHIIERPIEEWNTNLVNDFETSVFSMHPTIKEIKRNLYNLGATYASMSGSGSSVFGIFKEKPTNIEELFHPHFTFCTKL